MTGGEKGRAYMPYSTYGQYIKNMRAVREKKMKKRELEEQFKPSGVRTMREMNRIRYERENGNYLYNKDRYVNDRHTPPREYRTTDKVGQRDIAEQNYMDNVFNRKKKNK